VCHEKSQLSSLKAALDVCAFCLFLIKSGIAFAALRLVKTAMHLMQNHHFFLVVTLHVYIHI